MNNFPAAWQAYLLYEVGGRPNGGLHTDPDDPGGTTKYGIAQRYWRGVDVETLTEAQAQSLIEEEYWRRYRLDELLNPDVATLCLLAFTNMRPGSAASALQRACRVAAYTIPNLPDEELSIDGVIGPKTIAEANRLCLMLSACIALRSALRMAIWGEYLTRIHDSPYRAKWEKGWRRRALDEARYA